MKKDKKGGIIGKFLMFLIILVILILALNSVKGETITDIINITVTINSTNVVLNVSNSIYNINNTNSTSSIQQNFSVFYALNATNTTITSVCNNTSVSFSCSCPASVFPSVSCNVTGDVGLNNATKTEFFNHYQTTLQTKIEESSNKAAQDIIFKLEPAKIEIESLKSQAFNASLNEQEQVKNVVALSAVVEQKNVEIEQKNREIRWLQVIGISFVFVSIFIHLVLGGNTMLNRWKGLGGGE